MAEICPKIDEKQRKMPRIRTKCQNKTSDISQNYSILLYFAIKLNSKNFHLTTTHQLVHSL